LDGEPIEALQAVGMEPALQGPWSDPQVLSDLVMAAPTVGHQDGLAAVTQPTVGGGLEDVFKLLAIVVV
jgi:hypothetical protein